MVIRHGYGWRQNWWWRANVPLLPAILIVIAVQWSNTDGITWCSKTRDTPTSDILLIAKSLQSYFCEKLHFSYSISYCKKERFYFKFETLCLNPLKIPPTVLVSFATINAYSHVIITLTIAVPKLLLVSPRLLVRIIREQYSSLVRYYLIYYTI